MKRLSFQAFAALLSILLLAVGPGNALAKSEKPRFNNEFTNLCARAVGTVERAGKFPRHLMAAVSMVESGRWDAAKRERFAWPWTVTAGGAGRFFPSKKAAIAHVRKLQGRGVRNIDVGCMQINLKYHPRAFADLDHAFDPKLNAEYAGRFLVKLRRVTKSWASAVRHYHSSTPKRGRYYWNKVVLVWNDARRIANHKAHQARLEAYRKRRAARLATRRGLRSR